MPERAWGIKLGSGGLCVPFCEKHGIVGVGWKSVDPAVLAVADRAALKKHIQESCGWYAGNKHAIGGATGQLYRFARECSEGDFVLYYDPPRKHVRIGRVTSPLRFRDFEPGQDVDIWHYRTVELAPKPIGILDFYGGLKGSLLGPRMTFWDLGDAHATVQKLFDGKGIGAITGVADPALESAYGALRDLLVKRAEGLTAEDWEWLVVDYLKAQGAHVDERKVGKNHPIIDAEARFDHGELGGETWRVQVKRLKHKVDWPAIDADYQHVDDAQFCYVSVFGFTDNARQHAADEGVVLLEAGDFTRFLLSGKVRPSLREKLQLPFAG